MAVTPVGNIIYTNQNAPVASNIQQAQQQRLDFQNSLATEFYKDEIDKIKETNPPEELHKADPDSHQDASQDEQHKRARKKQTPKEPEPKQLSLLDIRV
ncbi:MAG: hypothetical protein ACTTIC_07665 [Helicobacteraceae bacterium]